MTREDEQGKTELTMDDWESPSNENEAQHNGLISASKHHMRGRV